MASTFIECGMSQAEGMPWHLPRPPIRPVHYSLGICLGVSTRPPRVRVLVGVFG